MIFVLLGELSNTTLQLLCQLYGDADKWMPHHNCPKGKVCSFAECKDAP